jgi:predicted acylesterase/phospholipase RssA
MHKVLSFTGGSTQGVGLSAIGVGILEHYEPTTIIGESVSAIFAIPLAMKQIDAIKEAMLSFTKDDIFGKYKPLNKKDSFPSLRAIFRILSGKNSLGKQNALRKYIKNYLTEDLFNEWKNNCSINVIVATTNYNTGQLQLFDLRKFNYLYSLDIILASCNIAVLINPISIMGEMHYDGGMIRANPGVEFIKDNGASIESYYSVWNRPNSETSKGELYKPNFKSKNIFNVSARTFYLMTKNQSLDSELLGDLLCNKYNITSRKYFLDTELDSLYDSDYEERILDWEKGLEIGRN